MDNCNAPKLDLVEVVDLLNSVITRKKLKKCPI